MNFDFNQGNLCGNTDVKTLKGWNNDFHTWASEMLRNNSVE